MGHDNFRCFVLMRKWNHACGTRVLGSECQVCYPISSMILICKAMPLLLNDLLPRLKVLVVPLGSWTMLTAQPVLIFGGAVAL